MRILMVPGDYSDEDGDGFLDACQDLVLVVHNEEGQESRVRCRRDLLQL